MKLIVGLGNPGRKYEQTRHNLGFMVADKVASLAGASGSKVRFEGQVAEGNIRGEKVVILWPQTFMNASGQSVRKAFDFYKLVPEDLLVVSDDLNLKTGRVRIRPAGSAGGQKGMADIIRHLGNDNFARLRIGIDRPPENWTVTDYVLGKFNKEEIEKIEMALDRATQAALVWVSEGIGPTMTRFNADPTSTKPGEPNRQQKANNIKRTAAEPADTDTNSKAPESKTE